MSLREQAAALETDAAQRIMGRMRLFGVDPDHVIVWSVSEVGYLDDRDEQLHAWPASMTRADVVDLVQLEGARRVFEEHARSEQ